MANNDLNRKLNYSDGEGLEHTDLNRQQHLLDAKVIEAYSHLSGGFLGNVFNLGQATGKENAILSALSGTDPKGLIPSNVMLDPFPLSGPFSGLDVTGDLFVQRGILGQAHNANMAGTRPDGSPDQIFIALDDEGGTPALNIQPFLVSNTAPAAGDPRWDVYAIRLGYGTDNSIARDFKDAVTQALSSTATDKDHVIVAAEEYQTGAVSATYNPTTAIAALTAGFVPCMIIRRRAGTGSTVNADDFHYLGFPMRLGVEDVMGYEGHFGGNVVYDSASAFAPHADATNPGGKASFQTTSLASTVDFFPRSMHMGCRLVGVAVSGNGFDQSFRLSLVRHDYDAAGVQTATIIADLDDASSSGRIASLTPGGIQYSNGIGSDPDWAVPTSTRFATPGYPIWGNGQTFGPTADDVARSIGTKAHSKLGLRISEESGQTFDASDFINFIRFVYLH